MSKRLKIIPNVRAAVTGAWAIRGDILRMSWFVVLLSVVLLSLMIVYGHEILEKLRPVFYIHEFPVLIHAENYLLLVISAALAAIVFVALFQKLLKGVNPQYKFLMLKRGVEEARELRIPFYFSFGKRELRYTIFLAAIFCFFQMLRDICFYAIAYKYYQDNMGHFPTQHLALNVMADIIIGSRYIILATLIVAGVYAGTAEKFDFAAFMERARVTRYNILRIVLITALIYLPLFVFQGIYSFLFHFLMARKISLGTIVTVNDIQAIVLQFCSFVWAVFAVNAYKGLAPDDNGRLLNA
jgi:hypothetical protein